MKANIEAEGQTKEDIVFALEEAVKKIKENYNSGYDENETGNYIFHLFDI